MSDIYEEIVDPAARRRVLTFGQNAKAKNVALVTEVKTSYLGSKHSATELHPHNQSYILRPISVPVQGGVLTSSGTKGKKGIIVL